MEESGRFGIRAAKLGRLLCLAANLTDSGLIHKEIFLGWVSLGLNPSPLNTGTAQVSFSLGFSASFYAFSAASFAFLAISAASPSGKCIGGRDDAGLNI